MRVVAVLPFVADEIEEDAHDLARFLSADAAAELSHAVEAHLVSDAVSIDAESLGAAAAALQAEAALGATLRLRGEEVQLDALVAGADGAQRASWSETLPLGHALQVGRMLARALLLALGDDAAAAPQSLEPEVSGEAVLRLCRASRRIEEGEIDAGADELLDLSAQLPALQAPRRALFGAARAAAGTDRMPAFLSVLERLAELHPDDAETLLELADYRVLHLEAPRAQQLYLRARDVAGDAPTGARACLSLAALAEEGGRPDEAIAHLRAAVQLADDANAYARLGQLLLSRDPPAALQALTRASVLAPEDPAILLQLARALREQGGDPARTLAVAAEAARRAESRPELSDQIAAELALLLRG
jgi:tetratricopeptide (TPR) repeat protein